MTLLVLFDIDGTLLRAGDPVHARAIQEALETIAGEAFPLDGIPFAGLLDREIARLALERHGFDRPTIARLLPEIMVRMGERYQQLVRHEERETWVLPGVRELIERLWARGHVVGVLTGNARAVARAKLAAAGLDRMLPFGAYGDQADERHELVARAREEARRRYRLDIPLERTILVGDTPRDIAAAHASGARILAVATGRFGVEALLEHGADAVLPDLRDTERALALLETIVVNDRRSDNRRLLDERANGYRGERDRAGGSAVAETHPFRLHPDEVARRARQFFEEQLGIPLVRDLAGYMRFEDPHGFVEIDIRGDANNQSRVTFQYQGYEQEVHQFRRLLAEQAQEETRQSE